MDSKHTVEEIMNLIQGHIDAGKSVMAQTYLVHCAPQLLTRERKAIAKGFEPLKAEHIINTDLSTMNKFGCSVGSAALVAFGLCLYKFLT